jgi:hypothetical protein
MNWNQLETRLASWTPRPPSPVIRKRLFRASNGQVTSYLEAHLWRLLTPGVALFLALCMLQSRTTQTFTPIISPTTGLVATVALSHPNLASYCADTAFTEHNIWPSSSFEWTNRSRSLTTLPPVFVTNHLIP